MSKQLFAAAACCLLSFGTAVAQRQPQGLSDLINTREPGWGLVQQWINAAKNPVEVLPRTPSRADSTLLAAQITTRSPMGAIIYETGGLLIDNGWLRILGSGSTALNRDLVQWNQDKQDGFLLIADDIAGGFFAINAGAFGATSIGHVFYMSPDTLRWQAVSSSYSEFLIFCFSGDLQKFYRELRWKAWQSDTRQISGSQGMAFYPFLFTTEGRNIEKVSRRPVPVQELWILYQDMQRQLDGR
ncbi:DUF2625 family protein [Hymenobacter puniceus]|uniref:DUF2625 family protein n=1 Tax=Hymenobacter sp. BT190 TaxID=2763505 RepID=UPI001650F8C4|nr:DUF2625 family protein [Hymenobacter sp. BT190]MBC6696754.1 DUF2625 domain-containing protein [Hymenobacter sp. BT190]